MIIPFVLIGVIIGLVVGVLFSWICRPKVIGYLRVDKTDPDGPYLFLETLDRETITSLPREREVILKVRVTDYSQK